MLLYFSMSSSRNGHRHDNSIWDESIQKRAAHGKGLRVSSWSMCAFNVMLKMLFAQGAILGSSLSLFRLNLRVVGRALSCYYVLVHSYSS